MASPPRIRTYRYRIYPTNRQGGALERQLRFACDLYNAALEQRRYGWRAGQRIGYVRQCRDLTEVRRAGDGPPQMSCSAMRDPLHRLERAFQAFFRRVKAGETPGYPRYRSRRRYDSLTWDAAWAITERRLALGGIGHLKVKWHRELPESAAVRTVTVRRVAGRWWASFALALPAVTRPPRTGMAPVGVDLGITTFAALSTGELVPGPRAYRRDRSTACGATTRLTSTPGIAAPAESRVAAGPSARADSQSPPESCAPAEPEAGYAIWLHCRGGSQCSRVEPQCAGERHP